MGDVINSTHFLLADEQPKEKELGTSEDPDDGFQRKLREDLRVEPAESDRQLLIWPVVLCFPMNGLELPIISV